MGNAAPQRVTVLARAKEAIELANDCLDRTRKHEAAIGGLAIRLDNVRDAQSARLSLVEQTVRQLPYDFRYRDDVTAAVSERLARFETMTFLDRLTWVLTGRTWAEQCARYEADL